MSWFNKKDGNKNSQKDKASPAEASNQPGTSNGQTEQAAKNAPAGSPRDVEARFASYGKIISVLERDQRLAQLPLRAINALVGPAIVTNQYAVVQSQKQGAEIAGPPVAVVIWANVSEEVDRKLTEGVNSTVELSAEDWKSGDIPWLMLSSGEERAINAVLKSLTEKLPSGKLFKARVTDKDGNNQVATLQVKERTADE